MNKIYNIHTIWLLMLLLTMSSYFIGERGYGGILAVVFLLLAALIKGGLIIREFMALKGVSLLWRVIMYGWLYLVCFAIAVCYFMSL